jgi:hypothetical protein
MRVILEIDENLLHRGRELTGITDETALVRAALEALIAREVAKRLAALGGTQPQLRPTRRRR